MSQDASPQTQTSFKAFLDLTFAPSLRLVPVVRDFVTGFYGKVFGDQEGLARLEVTAHELLENAVKNSTDGTTRLKIEYDPVRWIVTVRTLNYPTADNLDVLQQNVHDLQSSSDADTYYQKVLHRSAHQAEGSGLGLARVWAEAGFTIRTELEGAGGVWVIAESRVHGREEAS
ncbi:MAG TPA: hypothetical protein VIG99_33040 [Myxococcaceae bacterium]|jgi:hypothetical protein